MTHSTLRQAGQPRQSFVPTHPQHQDAEHQVRPPLKPLKPATAPWLRAALPSRNRLHPLFRRQYLLGRQILIQGTPRLAADPAPGCQQAYLSPCYPVIRATPGREVRGATGETPTSPGGWCSLGAQEHPPHMQQASWATGPKAQEAGFWMGFGEQPGAPPCWDASSARAAFL